MEGGGKSNGREGMKFAAVPSAPRECLEKINSINARKLQKTGSCVMRDRDEPPRNDKALKG